MLLLVVLLLDALKHELVNSYEVPSKLYLQGASVRQPGIGAMKITTNQGYSICTQVNTYSDFYYFVFQIYDHVAKM